MQIVKFGNYDDFINENYQAAKKFLAEKEVPIDDPRFQQLVKLLQKKQGLLFMFTKFCFEDEIPMNTLETLYDRLNTLQLKGLLSQIEQPVDTFKSAEKLSDALDKLDRIAKIRDLYRNFTSKLKAEYNNAAPEVLEEVSKLALSYYELPKPLQAEFVQKISRYHSIVDFISGLTDHINKSLGFSYELIKEKGVAKPGAHLVYDQDGILIYKITDYDASKALGSTQWCISYDNYYWESYVGSVDRYTAQYFIYNFKISIVDPTCMIGTTIDEDGSYYLDSIQGKDDVAIRKTVFEEYCQQYNIPMAALKPLDADDVAKKRATMEFRKKVKISFRNDDWVWIFDTFEEINDPFINSNVYLYAAIKTKNLDFIKKLLQHGYTFDSEVQKDDGYGNNTITSSVIDAAIDFHYSEEGDFVEDLIAMGFKPKVNEWYLAYLVRRGETERMKSLLKDLSFDDLLLLDIMEHKDNASVKFMAHIVNKGPLDLFTWVYDNFKPDVRQIGELVSVTLSQADALHLVKKEICDFIMEKYPEPSSYLLEMLLRVFYSYDFDYEELWVYFTQHKDTLFGTGRNSYFDGHLATLFAARRWFKVDEKFEKMLATVRQMIEWGCYDSKNADATKFFLGIGSVEEARVVALRSKEYGIELNLNDYTYDAVARKDFKNTTFLIEIGARINPEHIREFFGEAYYYTVDPKDYDLLELLIKTGKDVIVQPKYNSSYGSNSYVKTSNVKDETPERILNAIFDAFCKKGDMNMIEFILTRCDLTSLTNNILEKITDVYHKNNKIKDLVQFFKDDTFTTDNLTKSALIGFVYIKDHDNLRYMLGLPYTPYRELDNTLGNALVNAAIKVKDTVILDMLFDEFGFSIKDDVYYSDLLSKNRVEMMRYFFEKGYRCDGYQYHFSINMASSSNTEMIELFNKYNPKQVEKCKNDALLYASEHGNEDMVIFCLEHGADANYTKSNNYGGVKSPFEACCKSSDTHMDIFIALLQKGAKVTTKSIEFILSNNHPVLLGYLLDKMLVEKDSVWFTKANGSEMFTYLMTLDMEMDGAKKVSNNVYHSENFNIVSTAVVMAAKTSLDVVTRFCEQYKLEIDTHLQKTKVLGSICTDTYIKKAAFDYLYDTYADYASVEIVYERNKRGNTLVDHARSRLKFSIEKRKKEEKNVLKSEKDALKIKAKAEKDAATKSAKEVASATKLAAKAKINNESVVMRFSDFV